MTAPPPELGKGYQLDLKIVFRETLHRVYWRGANPLDASWAANNRYDCPADMAKDNVFGVLYLAFDLETCWMETVVRANMVRPAGAAIPIPLDKLDGRWACEVRPAAPLTFAAFYDEPLIHLGDCASNVTGDSYLRTRRWSELLHAHSLPSVDGLVFRSRFRQSQMCVALFERAIGPRGVSVVAQQDISPSACLETQSIMRRYGVVPI